MPVIAMAIPLIWGGHSSLLGNFLKHLGMFSIYTYI